MITSSVVRHLNARELTPLKLARWWKGFVLDILTDFVWVRCTTERSMKQMDQAFRGYLVLRLQDSGGWTPAWQQKSALPCLNDSCIHRKKKERYRKYNGKRERRRRCFVLFFLKDSMEYQTLWVLGCLLWKSSERPLLVCDFSHLLCTVKSEKEDAPLPTNYLYVWTFAFCLFQYKKEKEQKICLMISEKSPVWSGSL